MENFHIEQNNYHCYEKIKTVLIIHEDLQSQAFREKITREEMR